MRLARRHGERRRVREDLRWLPALLCWRVGERKRGLGEAQVKADQAADTTHRAGKGRREGCAGLRVPRLAEVAVVEEVELVIAAGRVDPAVWRDPDRAVEKFGGLSA